MTLRTLGLRASSLSAPRMLCLAGAVLASTTVFAQANQAPASGASATPAAPTAQQKFDPQAQASPFGGTVVEDIVARVNDQIITRSDYDRAMQQLEHDGQQQGWSQQDLMDRKRDLLRDLVDQQLLLSKGKELGITGETELVKRLDEIRKQNHLDSMEALEKAATSQGVSYEDFKQNIRNGIITQQVIRDEVGRHLQMSRAELQRYYQQHQSEFSQPESVHLSEILIPVPTGGDANADLQTAQAKADAIEAKLKSGASFEELAKTESAGSTAAQGGDLGEFRRGMLAKTLEDQTFDLNAGQFTQPIRTKQGYIILKVTQHTKGGTPDLASIEPQVEEAAFMSKMQPALRQYLTQLRQQAYIDYKPGYVDTAATSESVKPLYSAYAPPAPKKHVKFKRTRFRQAHSLRKKSKSADTDVASAGGSNATGTPAATGTTAPARSSEVARTSGIEKPGKKEKIRFGQAPREALPPSPAASAGTETAAVDTAAPAAGATPAGESQVATSVSPNVTGDAVAPTETAGPEKKTRFSDRARLPKTKKAKTADQIENASVDKVTPEEIAAQKTQSAPLGLAGNTLHPKKQPKPKAEKTRYSDQAKDKKDESPAPAAPGTPSPLAAPAAGNATAAPANGTAPAADTAAPATDTTAPAGTGAPATDTPPAGAPAPQ